MKSSLTIRNAGVVLPRELKALQEGLEALPRLANVLSSVQKLLEDSNALIDPLAWLARELAPLPELVELLQRAISNDPSGNVGDGSIIKDGFSEELDELKSASKDARTFIAGLEQKERERHDAKRLKDALANLENARNVLLEAPKRQRS